MSYQEKTGTLSQGAHPGSYSGQDAYSDLLVTERERERERWARAIGNGQVHQLYLQEKVGALNCMADPQKVLVFIEQDG